MRFAAGANGSLWHISTCCAAARLPSQSGIADMAGPAACPAQSRLTYGNRRTAPSKRACTGPGSAQLFLISRPPALILIAAPFSSRLSRYNSATFGDLHAPCPQGRPFFATNQKRMGRFVESRTRQLIATPADPPLNKRQRRTFLSYGYRPVANADHACISLPRASKWSLRK